MVPRAKRFLVFFPFASKVRLVYDRCTVTPVATAFVFVALAHCIVQISLQSISYSANAAAGNTISQVFCQSNVSKAYAYVDDGVLKACDNAMNMDECQIIATAQAFSMTDSSSVDDVLPELHDDASILRRDFNLSSITVQCIEALNRPQSILNDARREDACFLVYQVWLLGISLVTVLNESIPHLITALVTYFMSSIWSVFQVSRTEKYGKLYRSIVVEEACEGVNVLSGFWAKRLTYFIPILVLNVIAALITAIVSYGLFKARWTFR